MKWPQKEMLLKICFFFDPFFISCYVLYFSPYECWWFIHFNIFYLVRQCQISVQHAKVIQIRPKVVKILCHPGYSTSTGQNGLLIRCKKKLRNAKLNFCYPKSQKYSHPYPLFQSDDPKIDDNIILLDNNDAVKKTGVYNIEGNYNFKY